MHLLLDIVSSTHKIVHICLYYSRKFIIMMLYMVRFGGKPISMGVKNIRINHKVFLSRFIINFIKPFCVRTVDIAQINLKNDPAVSKVEATL